METIYILYRKAIMSFVVVFCWMLVYPVMAQSDDECLMCHEGQDLRTERHGKTVSLDVQPGVLLKSVHKNVTCAGCHEEAGKELPHAETLPPVQCGRCHKASQMEYDKGIHGQAAKLKVPYAPDCKLCHGKHDIYPSSSEQSLTYKMNIPVLCGRCHREGLPVSELFHIPEKNILENYSQGIHGKGLFKSGLIVTATCNNCHGNHLILPHTSPNSSISASRIAKTCMQCHVKIEEVHAKVIKNELWEKQPGRIPACSECHPPHKVQIEKQQANISNQLCLKCHEKTDVVKMVDGQKVSLHVTIADVANSVHTNISCMKCHTDVDVSLRRPCETARSVECSTCHNEVSEKYFSSGHGTAFLRKNPNAPFCTDCHGTHRIKSRFDDTSPTYRGAIPQLCGNCHKEDGKALAGAKLKEINAYADYSSSVHGHGLREKGLLVSAVCTDCHTTHFILKEEDERATIHPKNISKTCSNCHKSIYEDYIASDHSILNGDDEKSYPTCAYCHSAHVISEIDDDKFMTQVTHQCGSCHEKLAETYLETYHGKAYQLGYLKAARCSDCHGSHKILNVRNPESAVGYKHIVNTCQQCHSNANLRFTGYLTHATHNDNKVLYYTFWGMTSLLLGVFGFFGLHTLLWLPRSIKEAIRKKKHKKESGTGVYYRRFTRSQRVTHIFVILSFILLALTGMTLKFAHMEWASVLAKLFGGIHMANLLHRFGAIITFGYFGYHIFSLFSERKRKGVGYITYFFGPNSLAPNKQDLKDFVGTIKWFLGKGPRPQYGRWTYWEKFDYLAVFWGVAIIGFSGLMLWFPEFFTMILPGWTINVAQIIHSDEALLAVGFIFTIHFFNTHLRPESFPMDTVIFTGHVPLEEYKEDRQREYQELEAAGKLGEVTVNTEITPSWLKSVKFFGYLFLFLGLALVILIVYSLLAGSY